MLLPEQIIKALEEVALDFQNSNKEFSQQIAHLRQKMRSHKSLSLNTIRSRLGWPEQSPGAYPTNEQSLSDQDWLPCTHLPSDSSAMEDWKDWAHKILSNVTTCAVDGSQIFPTGHWAVPFGAIQIATFENHHDGTYSKTTRFEIVPPKDFSSDDDSSFRQIISERRHRAETATLANWIKDQSSGKSSSLAIFDGTLITSFASGPDRPAYVKSMTNLLEASATSKIPLIAYIDGSRARDLSTMHGHLAGIPTPRIPDSALLKKSDWGSRTPVYICARNQGLDGYGAWARKIGFLYLRSSREGLPARLEFPMWIVEDDLLEDVVDQVRAEIIAQGSGYPYAIEAADVTAVINADDRRRFEAILSDFANKHGFHVSLRTKDHSKRRRR